MNDAIDRAREVGYLVAPPSARAEREEWMRVVRAEERPEERPFVAIMAGTVV
jgi:hypothetical protein